MTVQLNLSKATPMLDLAKVAPSLVKVKGMLLWDENPVHKASLTQGFDLDIFAFLTQGNKIEGVQDVVYFNNKTAYGDAVVYPRDCRTGDCDEEITITLGSIPANKEAVELFVFLHEADQRKQDFSMIQGGSFTLYDAVTGDSIQSYSLQQFVNGSALHVGTLKRSGSGWGFQPVGESAQADANQVLSGFL